MRKLLLLCFLVIARTSSAEVTENLVYTSYVANADPTRPLLSTLNASSPYRQSSQILHAYTNWHVNWNFRWFEKPDGKCRISSVTTKLTGNIHLPKLVGANSTQGSQFEKYLSALRVHEQGHYSIGKEAATAIDRKILSLGEMSSCKALEAAANDLGNRTINEYKEKELRYDDSTAHGKTQGAWLDGE
ncbi:MAG TPA: DUF922 domain-containing protein [Syntrophales bacterium]|nr:DUF922 domain-containing protein [Syntrophales bacterium]